MKKKMASEVDIIGPSDQDTSAVDPIQIVQYDNLKSHIK